MYFETMASQAPNSLSVSGHVTKQSLANLTSAISETIQIGDQFYHSYIVPGDGNCFFHTLSLTLQGDFSHTALYRNVICAYIEDTWTQWKEWAALCHDQNINREMYREMMVKNNGWASTCEIEAAAIILGVAIKVFLKDNKTGRFTCHFCTRQKI